LTSSDAQFAFLSSPNQAARQFIEITAGPNMQKCGSIAALVGGVVMVAGINVAPAQEEEYEHGREMYRQHESDVPETTNEQSGYYHEQARERAEQQRRQQQQRFDEEMRELAEQEWRQQQQLGERGTARPNPPVPKPLAHDSLSLPNM
jgi:hypothetical protein